MKHSSGGDSRSCSSSSVVLKKGPWTAEEDKLLIEYVNKHGDGNWNSVSKKSGLSRCGKSCRLRWTNHLRPNLRKGSFSLDEEKIIAELHSQIGNKWSRMAAQLPGRTDNEIKNFWNTRIKRRQREGKSPYPQGIQKEARPTQFSSFCGPNYGSGSGSSSIFSQISVPSVIPLLSHKQSTTFGSIPFHGLKEFQGSGVGPVLPFSAQPPLPSPLFRQTFPTQFPLASIHQRSSNSYDSNPPRILQTPFEPDGVGHCAPAFPIELELPSNQLPAPAANAAALGGPQIDYKKTMPLAENNSGLLDALLQEANAISSSNGLKEEQRCESNGWANNSLPYGCIFRETASTSPPRTRSEGVGFSSADRYTEVVMKKEPKGMFNAVGDDQSSIFDIIPSTMSTQEWNFNNGDEISNGQSSGVTDDDIYLEMQKLVSSLAPVNSSIDHDWTIGTWNKMPQLR